MMSEKKWESFNRSRTITNELVNVTKNGAVMLYLCYDETDQRYWVHGTWTNMGSFAENPCCFFSRSEAETYFKNLFWDLYDPETDDFCRENFGYATYPRG